MVDGRDEGAEEGSEAEGDSVSKGDAEVADGEAESDSTDSPKNAEEDGIADAAGVIAPGLAEDGPDMRDEDARQQRRRDDPRGKALDEPVDLPRPALDLAEGDEVGSGAEAADPMEDDAKKRIRSQGSSLD